MEHAPALRHLVCFGHLEPRALLTIETLTLDLDERGAQQLASLAAPRLTALHTRVTAKDEAALLRSLARAHWFHGLQTWTHRIASTEGLAALLANGPLVARSGERLVLLCDEGVLKSVPDELRRALPRAKFALLATPRRPSDADDFHGPMTTRVVPATAPMDFRARQAVESSSTHGIQSDDPVVTKVGSGFALEPYLFSTCSWCGGANTLGIHSTSWSLYSHFERTSYDDWEYECHDCGLFTTMRSGRTH